MAAQGQVLFCLPIRRVILKHHREWLAVAAGSFEVDQLVPGRVIWLAVLAAPLHPDDVHAPAFGDLVDEDQRFLALFAGVLKEQVHIRREGAAVCFEDLVDHVPAGATTTDADLGRTCDQIGIHNYSRQPIASPAGVIRKSGLLVV